MTSTQPLSKLLDAVPRRDLPKLIRAIEHQLARRQLERYRPYIKQADFHAASIAFRERLFMAGNQLGKTKAGSMEAAMHATGRYPAWWSGRRFDKPTNGWAAGITGETTRDTVQKMLLGPKSMQGTGAIPPVDIIHVSPSRGLADAADTATIRHVSGGQSMIGFKSYEKGREKWQGPTLDYVWFDEEPPLDIYTEGLTRIAATNGIVWMTFTPLLGMSEVVRRYLMEESRDRHVTRMEIDDAGHYTPEQRERVIAGYPEHEREARAKGIPVLGSGKVYPVTEESIRWESRSLPKHWSRIAGIDFGWEHPTACVWLAWDKDADTVYVYDCYRQNKQVPAVHAAAIRAKGVWIPIAWPHDALQHDKGSGQTLAAQYRGDGLKFLGQRAQFPDGGSGVEAGIQDILERMQTGRLKVAVHLVDWWEEFRLYHRKDGLILKERDDLMDATRYGIMMLRHAVQEQKDGPPPAPIQLGGTGGGAWMQ